MSIYQPNNGRVIPDSTLSTSEVNGNIFGSKTDAKWSSQPKGNKKFNTSISRFLDRAYNYSSKTNSVSFSKSNSVITKNITYDSLAYAVDISNILKPSNGTLTQCVCLTDDDCAPCSGIEPINVEIPCSIYTSCNLGLQAEPTENSNSWNIIDPLPSEFLSSGNLIEFTSIINDGSYTGTIDMTINTSLLSGDTNLYSFTSTGTGIIVGNFITSQDTLCSFNVLTEGEDCSLYIEYAPTTPCVSQCSACESPEPCCGGEFPRLAGQCCEDEWRMGGEMSASGVCCGGIWYTYDEQDPNYIEGQCCGNIWRTEPGLCCNEEWYPAENPCPSGQIFLEWGNDVCCGCLPEQILDPITEQTVNTVDVVDQLCCPPCGGLLPSLDGCAGNCCYYTQEAIDNNGFPTCENLTQSECLSKGPTATFTAGLCCNDNDHCPAICCSETLEGTVECNNNTTLGECISQVTFAGTYSNQYLATCENICVGACCDGTTLIGIMSQDQCSNSNGYWLGLGTDSCPEAFADCRSPFSDSCCETKQSSGQSLVFTQPFFYKLEPFNDTLRATVSGTTTSPILIHGTLLATEATPSNRCNYNHSFVLCGDSFYVEPISYEYGFHNLEATVCWTQESVQEETLNFSGSNNLDIVLGTSKYNCITTLSYTGNGHTSNSSITLDGDSVIDGSGDELVLTGQITSQSENLSTLTLSGDSLNNNISGIISGNIRVVKDGPGSWKLTGNNTFTERLEVKSGTLVVSSVVFSGSSPIGENAEAPIIGDDNSGASFLLENATLNRGGLSIIPGTGVVTIGSIGLSTFSNSRTIELGRDVTLQASPSGIATFSNTWTGINGSPNPSGSISIGSVDNDGVVVFDSLIPDTISSININYGTLQIDIDVPEYNGAYGPISYATPMYIYGATLSLNNVDQSLASISFEEPISNIGGEGTLRLYNSSGSAALNINSSNNIISSNISLDSSAVLSGDGSLTILGIISGANNLVKNDSGSVTLSGANSYSGTTTINGGIMVAGHISAFGTGNIIINSGATLDRNGFTLANNITNNGGIILN